MKQRIHSIRPLLAWLVVLIAVMFSVAAAADETCNSPYMTGLIETPIGDGHPVGATGQTCQDGLRSGKGPLGASGLIRCLNARSEALRAATRATRLAAAAP
jgi:hypothetical protein